MSFSTTVEHASDNPPEVRILTRDDGATIAYRQTPGKSPGVVFLTGFKSDMTGGKATAVERFCRDRGQAVVRFDYSGHGRSSGIFEDGTIGQWAEDTILVLDKLTHGPQILVGSSLGGWIMLLAALARPGRIAGLIGLAPAPDFTEELMWSAFSEAEKAEMKETGFIEIPNCYDDQEGYRISARLIDEARNHLLLRQDIPVTVPVRLIHGMQDADVPWSTSQRLSERLKSNDVEVTFVKSGDHRLSEPTDINRLTQTLATLLDQLTPRKTP